MTRTTYKRLFPAIAIAFILVFSGQESCAKDSMFGYNSYDTHIETEAQKRDYPYLFRFQRWCSNHKKSILCISGGIVAAALVYAGYRGQLYNRMFECCFGSTTPTTLPSGTPTPIPSEAPASPVAPSVGNPNEALDRIKAEIDRIAPEIRTNVVNFLEKFRQSPGVVISVSIGEGKAEHGDIYFCWQSAAGPFYNETMFLDKRLVPIERLTALPDNAFLRYLLSEMQYEGRTVLEDETVSLDELPVKSSRSSDGSKNIFVDFRRSVVPDRVSGSTTSVVGGSVRNPVPNRELVEAQRALDEIDPKIRENITAFAREVRSELPGPIHTMEVMFGTDSHIIVSCDGPEGEVLIKTLCLPPVTVSEGLINNELIKHLASEMRHYDDTVEIIRVPSLNHVHFGVTFPQQVNPVQNIAPLPSSRSVSTTHTTRTVIAPVPPVQPGKPVSVEDILNARSAFEKRIKYADGRCKTGKAWPGFCTPFQMRQVAFHPVLISVQDNLAKMESLLKEPDFLSEVNGFIDKFQIASEENQTIFMDEVQAMLQQHSSCPQLIQKQMAAGFAYYWIFDRK